MRPARLAAALLAGLAPLAATAAPGDLLACRVLDFDQSTPHLSSDEAFERLNLEKKFEIAEDETGFDVTA